MPRGLGTEKFDRWVTRLKAAQKFFDDENAKSDEIVRYYQRNVMDDLSKVGVRMGWRFPVNLLRADIDTLIATSYAGVPRVLAKARDETTAQQAKSIEKFFNWLLPQTGWHQTRQRMIRTALLRGWNVAKILWKPSTLLSGRPEEEDLPVYEPRSIAETIPPGAPFLERLSNYEFLCDPAANMNLHKARWWAHRVRRPIEEVQDDREYKNRDKIQASRVSRTFDTMVGRRPPGTYSDYPDQDLCEYYEVWTRSIDGLTRKKFVIAPESSVMLQEPDDWPHPSIEAYPADILSFSDPEEEEDLEETTPLPETASWMPVQRSINLLYSLAVGHIARFNRKYAYSLMGITDPQVLEKWAYGEDGASVGVNTPDVRQALMAIDHASLPPEYFAALDRAVGLWQQVSGVGELQRGEAAASTAATVGAIQQHNASRRAGKMRQIIAASDTRILRLMKQMMQDQVSEEIVFQVAGSQGSEWVHVTPEMLRLELDITVDVDSIAPESLEQRKQRNLIALQTVGPLLANPNGVPAGVRELIRRNLTDIGFEDAELFLPPLAGQLPDQEHTAWLLGESPPPQVRPEDDDTAHIAAHSAFVSKYQPKLAVMVAHEEPMDPETGEEGEQITALQVIETHIAEHEAQLQQKRAMGGLSVRGSLKPMAPAAGTPGGITGSPISSDSISAPIGLPA